MPTPPTVVAIVDDEESVRRALERLLRSAGFAVETFPSGAEFLLSLPEHQPACLVLDLHMPDLSGLDVQLLIKREGFEVPIVIITGHDTAEVRARIVARGASAYLRKPVDDKQLLAAIAEAIGGSGRISQNQSEIRST
jgi:FixJ family two-component response regulator